MELLLLKTHRTKLMGVAILWVMFFHSHIDTGSSMILEFIKRTGYGGVDIFMLLSGFGVYHSISKDSSTKNFLKKRALRILPYYLPIVLEVSLLAYYIGIWDLNSVIHNLLMTGFWFDIGLTNMFDWYIPALMFLYSMTPLFYKFFKINKTATTLSVIIFFYAINYLTNNSIDYLYNFTFRVPLYIFGFWVADFLKNHPDYKMKNGTMSLLALALLAGVGMLYYFYQTSYFDQYGTYLVPFAFITFPLCLLLTRIFSLWGSYKFPVLTFFGTYSLTLYIFHEKILYMFTGIYFVKHADIITFIITVALAFLWQKIVEKIVSRFTKPILPQVKTELTSR